MLPFPPYRYGNPAAMGKGFVGPLDAYTTGLQSMFLPFRGLTAYTGYCWTVRDAGNSDALINVPFKDDGDCAAFSTIGTPFLKTWYNQQVIAGVTDMTSASDSAQPQVLQNQIGVLPTLKLDGGSGNNTAVNATTNNGGYTRTLYVVAKKRTAQTSANVGYFAGFGSVAASFIADNTGSPALSGGWGWRASAVTIQMPLGGNVQQWSLLVFKSTDASNGTGYIDNSVGAFIDPASAVSSSNLVQLLSAGAAGGADVDVAAMLEYNVTHDDTTRQSIQSILAAKFGISLA